MPGRGGGNSRAQDSQGMVNSVFLVVTDRPTTPLSFPSFHPIPSFSVDVPSHLFQDEHSLQGSANPYLSCLYHPPPPHVSIYTTTYHPQEHIMPGPTPWSLLRFRKSGAAISGGLINFCIIFPAQPGYGTQHGITPQASVLLRIYCTV